MADQTGNSEELRVPLAQNGSSMAQKCTLEKAVESDQVSVNFSSVTPMLYYRRFLMLGLFASYSMTSAYQWIHLNIVGDKILIYYNSSLPESEFMKVRFFHIIPIHYDY